MKLKFLIFTFLLFSFPISAKEDWSQYYFTGEIGSSKRKLFYDCGLNESKKGKFYIFNGKAFVECAGANDWIPKRFQDGKYKLKTDKGLDLLLEVNSGNVVDLVFDNKFLTNQKLLIEDKGSCLIASFINKYKIAYEEKDYEQYNLGYSKNHNYYKFKEMAFKYHDDSLKVSDIDFGFFRINLIYYNGQHFATYEYMYHIDKRPVIKVNGSEFCLKKINSNNKNLLAANCNNSNNKENLFLRSENCIVTYLNK